MIRKQITSAGKAAAVYLNESGLMPDPIDQFAFWYEQTRSAGIIEPDAMTLATSSLKGKPSARMVLLKGFDKKGFVFFTNYLNRKKRELTENPNAALVFWWGELKRQGRVEGKVEKISLLESAAYFNNRPRGSQLAAHVSRQSEVIPDRAILEKCWEELDKQYQDSEIPQPIDWGGFCLRPTVIEFWQERIHRLPDRLRYSLQKDLNWKIERLSP